MGGKLSYSLMGKEVIWIWWKRFGSRPHSSTLAWKIPWMEEPGRLQSMGSPRVGHDWATSLSCIGEGNGNPLQYACLENPRDGGACWAAVYGVAQSRTRLKRLSSSSSSSNVFNSIPFTRLWEILQTWDLEILVSQVPVTNNRTVNGAHYV